MLAGARILSRCACMNGLRERTRAKQFRQPGRRDGQPGDPAPTASIAERIKPHIKTTLNKIDPKSECFNCRLHSKHSKANRLLFSPCSRTPTFDVLSARFRWAFQSNLRWLLARQLFVRARCLAVVRYVVSDSVCINTWPADIRPVNNSPMCGGG